MANNSSNEPAKSEANNNQATPLTRAPAAKRRRRTVSEVNSNLPTPPTRAPATRRRRRKISPHEDEISSNNVANLDLSSLVKDLVQQQSQLIKTIQLQVFVCQYKDMDNGGVSTTQHGAIPHQQPAVSGLRPQLVAALRNFQQEQANGISSPHQPGAGGAFSQKEVSTALLTQFHQQHSGAPSPQNQSLKGQANAMARDPNLRKLPVGSPNLAALQGLMTLINPTSKGKSLDILRGPDGQLPQKIRHLEPHLLERIVSEIMDQNLNVHWDDIAGLQHVKKSVMEMIVWPLIRPDIFKGCRAPGRGLLLFGPPGTGKTMIGKAIAGEVKATFFHASASTLASKWVGDGEKLVRALFGVARCLQPAVIFFDELDSILSKRGEREHEASRRLKTQFLIEMEGVDTGNDQILLIGATNRPQDLDEAARRRLSKRLYVPLPSSEARAYIIRNLLEKDGLFTLSQEDMDVICHLTNGYSGSDMRNLVKETAMGPLREAMKQGVNDIRTLKAEELRPVSLRDFQTAMQTVGPSISNSEITAYVEWNKQFGNMSM